ncbi:hypothetical protein [Candidatus Solincola sp.]|jgi:hypothetical protein|nr:hypothetical protein [Actinomycetota bacterium]MDI7252649.1 hypothetical protein [Actinomycetota bacterium]
MPGPARLFPRIALGFLVFLVLGLFPGCGKRAAEPAAPAEGTGRPQVINFWQPG